MKRCIPNFITLLNMLSGIISIFMIMQGNPVYAAYMIFIAAIFDFLDGMAARLLNAKTEIGAQLDSLADVVSFGVAPGFIMFQMLILSHGQPLSLTNEINFIPFVGFIIPLFGALRLAKFNIDDEQTDAFKGLPIPAMAILVASLPLIRENLSPEREFFYMIITNTYFLITVAIIGSLLMVSNLPMFSLKFKQFGFKKNMTKYVFLVIAVLLLIFFQVIAIPFIILVYFFISLVLYLVDM